ncbi:TolC family protein [Pseudopedobacter beijingensis]|uniref:TolC family protein n=1 Tax=Pseudopedobacter beijingensis TaxID=1207056 RepID=A0ABW4I7M5_9SPHI
MIFLTGLVSLKVSAQEKLGLEQIIAEISKNNLQLQALGHKAESQQAQTEGAKAWMAPMIGAGTFMAPYPGQKLMNDADKGSLMFSLEQAIPTFGINKSKEKYYASLSETTEARKNMALNDLKAIAKENYWNIAISKQKISLLKENIDILKTMKKLGEIRYQYNKGNLSQIYKTEGRIAETENILDEIQNEIAVSKININILMYRAYHLNFDIEDGNISEYLPKQLIDTAFLTQHSSAIKMADTEIKSMHLESELIKKQANPEISLKFDHMSSFSSMMPQQYSAMAMLSIPIAPWSSKSYKSSLKTNKLEIESLQKERDFQINSLIGAAQGLEKNIINTNKIIAKYNSSVLPNMKKSLNALLLDYQENKEELSNVIDGWETLNKIHQDYINQLQKLSKLIIDYEKIIEK